MGRWPPSVERERKEDALHASDISCDSRDTEAVGDDAVADNAHRYLQAQLSGSRPWHSLPNTEFTSSVDEMQLAVGNYYSDASSIGRLGMTGTPAPVSLESAEANPRSLALEGSTLFWARTGGIMARPK